MKTRTFDDLWDDLPSNDLAEKTFKDICSLFFDAGGDAALEQILTEVKSTRDVAKADLPGDQVWITTDSPHLGGAVESWLLCPEWNEDGVYASSGYSTKSALLLESRIGRWDQEDWVASGCDYYGSFEPSDNTEILHLGKDADGNWRLIERIKRDAT